MAEIGRWNGFTFTVSPTLIRGFTGLTVKGSCEVKEKAQNKQQYVARKKGKPSEVSLSVILSAAMGCDVRKDALELVKCATDGAKDYFYVGEGKLLTCKLMLVDATVKETVIGDGTTWISAEVQLTMKQCDKSGGTPDSGGGGNKKKKKRKKKSVKKSSTTSSQTVDAVSRAAPSVSRARAQVQQGVRRAVSAATNAIRRITSAARTVTTRRTTTGGGGGTRYNMTR